MPPAGSRDEASMHHQSDRRTGPPASKPRNASPPHDHADAAAAPGDNAIAPAPGTDSRMRTHRPIPTAHTAAVISARIASVHAQHSWPPITENRSVRDTWIER